MVKFESHDNLSKKSSPSSLNMDQRKSEKIQMYPPKQHVYSKMTNQLPKVTKTIMSPLTTMPSKRPMHPTPTGVPLKPTNFQQSSEQNITRFEKMQPSADATAANISKPLTENKSNVNTKESSTIANNTIMTQNVDRLSAEKQKENGGYRSEKIALGDVNPYITCFLCRGYLIEATTIVECLHTFCHSCLMKHLTREKCCPQCEMSINKSKTNIKYDATIQSIVYKLVPGLYQKELLRRRAFYRQRPNEAKLASPEERGDDTEHLIFSPSDLMSLSLDYAEKKTLRGMQSDPNIQNLLKPKFLNCPAIFKVEHLKKFILSKFLINSFRFNVEISYKVKTIVLPEHYTLMDVAYIYTWKKEAPMPFFFRIIAKNSKFDELPEVSLRRSPAILPADAVNVVVDTSTKKKSVSFKEEVESIENQIVHEPKQILNGKQNENVINRKANETNVPRVETIKLKLDVSNNNVSIIKNTDSAPLSKADEKAKKRQEKKEKKSKLESSFKQFCNEKSAEVKSEPKKDEYEFDDDIEQQKLGFLNTFQLTAKKVLSTAHIRQNDEPKSAQTSSISSEAKTIAKVAENNVNKRKNKEPVKTAPKKYKFHEMKTVGEGNKFLFTKTGDGREITFDMSPKPLGSKPPLSKVKSDILQAQQRADAKATNKTEPKSPNNNNNNNIEQASVMQEKPNAQPRNNVPIKPKKLPMLLPKQSAPISSPSTTPGAISPTAFVIKKPEIKKEAILDSTSEISVTKINDQNHTLRVYGPKNPVNKQPVKDLSPTNMPPPQTKNKSPDTFALPLPPKQKPSSLNFPPNVPLTVMKPYGHPLKLPKNIPENMQTPYGMRTPFYVPNSPSYTPNFDAKPQFKYTNPTAYQSFFQNMFGPSNTPAGKVSPPLSQTAPKIPAEASRKRPSPDNSSPVPPKRKTPSPTKSISILEKINFPSSLSVTLTNEQEENKKEQMRNQKQNVVNNNIEIIKISDDKEQKQASETKSPSPPKIVSDSNANNSDKKSQSDRKNNEPKKLPLLLPAPPTPPSTMANNSMLPLPPPIAKALSDSKESFQRAFLESLMTVNQNLKMKKDEVPKKSSNKTGEQSNSEKVQTSESKDLKPIPNLKSIDHRNMPMMNMKPPSKATEGSQNNSKKNLSLTPPPTKSNEKLQNNSLKSLTPPPMSMQDSSVFASNAASAMQFNMMLNALNAAAKSSHFALPDYANIQRTMLLETLRQNVEKSNALLAMHHQIQQNQKNSSPSSSSPSSSKN